jgi:hypothetical protein
MEDRDNITLNLPFEMELQTQGNTTEDEETYIHWWKAQFVYGRTGVTVIKVKDASPA